MDTEDVDSGDPKEDMLGEVWTGGLPMKYTKEQRLEIGRRIYEGEVNRFEAAAEYDIGPNTNCQFAEGNPMSGESKRLPDHQRSWRTTRL